MRTLCETNRSFGRGLALIFAVGLLAPVPANAVCLEAPDNLVAWWPGEGDASDVVGQNHGELQGGATIGDGKAGQAFHIDGTSQSVLVPATTELNVGTGSGLTLELWVNPDSNAAREPVIEWNRNSGTPNWGVHLWLATSNLDLTPRPGNVYANVVDSDGGNHVFFSANDYVTAGVFQHIALTYDKASGTARLFHEGVAIAESNLGVFTPQTSYDLYFGRRPGPVSPTDFGGAIDEVSLYDRALSAEEILGLRNAGSAGKCLSLCGDGNRDRDIKAGDALFVLQTAVETASCALCVCDVNDSNTITAGDALNVLRNAVGTGLLLTCPPCDEG
jgi:hypothetical protein